MLLRLFLIFLTTSTVIKVVVIIIMLENISIPQFKKNWLGRA